MTDPKFNAQNAGGDPLPVFDPDDIEKNKVVAGLAYILFFLPLIVCSDSQFGRFHANQGLLLLILCVAGNFILSLIPIIGILFFVPLFSLFVFVLFIMGLVNGFSGKAKELPLIGKFRLIK